MDKKTDLFTLPNLLSGYRLLSFPFLFYLIAAGNKNLFIPLYGFNLFTDILDGWIARKFHLQSAIGAKLDSLADTGSIILAIYAMIVFENVFIDNHLLQIILIITLYILPYVVALLKFKKFPSLHLYSAKVTGYAQAIFFLLLFSGNCPEWYFYLMMIISCLSYMEEITCLILMKELKANARSIYHIYNESV